MRKIWESRPKVEDNFILNFSDPKAKYVPGAIFETSSTTTIIWKTTSPHRKSWLEIPISQKYSNSPSTTTTVSTDQASNFRKDRSVHKDKKANMSKERITSQNLFLAASNLKILHSMRRKEKEKVPKWGLKPTHFLPGPRTVSKKCDFPYFPFL